MALDFVGNRVLVTIIKYLSPGAQQYLNTVSQTGRYSSSNLPAGVTLSGRRLLDKIATGQDFSVKDLLGAGLLKESAQRIDLIEDAVEKARAFEEPKFPYYNPATSTVESLTVGEARNAGLLGNYAGPEKDRQVATEGATPSDAGPSGDGIDQAALAGAEFGVPPTTREPYTAPPGYEWVYDPLQSKPVLQKIGEGSAATTVDTGDGVGGVPGAVTAPVAETPPVPVDWETAAQEMYPEYYAIVKNNPEIAELLKKSAQEGWTEQKFAAELRGTNWYQTTTSAAREWDTASALDPASYQAKVDEAATAIQTEALNLGIRLSDATLQKLALDSERLGWGAQTITNAIGMAATEGGSEGATQLREGYYGQSVRSLAKQYGVTLADQTFNSFVNKLAVGEETLGSFQDYAMTIGKSLYPPLAEQFDAGRTFEDITASYKNIAADILERDVNSIDMAKPEWVQAITYVPDAKTGEQRLMNMGEWGDYLRKTESLGYQNTTEARSRAYEVGNKIANMFGRI